MFFNSINLSLYFLSTSSILSRDLIESFITSITVPSKLFPTLLRDSATFSELIIIFLFSSKASSSPVFKEADFISLYWYCNKSNFLCFSISSP